MCLATCTMARHLTHYTQAKLSSDTRVGSQTSSILLQHCFVHEMQLILVKSEQLTCNMACLQCAVTPRQHWC